MFVVKLTYKVSIQEVDRYLQHHNEYLDDYYRQAVLLASGPLKPRTGELIIVASKDKKLVESMMQKHPFYLAGIAEYEYFEFTPAKHCSELKELIQNTEGKLC